MSFRGLTALHWDFTSTATYPLVEHFTIEYLSCMKLWRHLASYFGNCMELFKDFKVLFGRLISIAIQTTALSISYVWHQVCRLSSHPRHLQYRGFCHPGTMRGSKLNLWRVSVEINA